MQTTVKSVPAMKMIPMSPFANVSPKPPLATPQNRGKKRMFTRELKQIMYGFGDVKNPAQETVDLVEDIMCEYVTEMTKKAVQVSSKRGKVLTEDFVFIIRKDRKKYNRVKELLVMNEELKKARKVFELEGEKL